MDLVDLLVAFAEAALPRWRGRGRSTSTTFFIVASGPAVITPTRSARKMAAWIVVRDEQDGALRARSDLDQLLLGG
jgi:hypothetical protein